MKQSVEDRRKRIEENIEKTFRDGDYREFGKVEPKNVLIIGQRRSGKSTIEAVLLDPKRPAPDITLAFGTREASFESFIVDRDSMVINIVDTPVLFETRSQGMSLRVNLAIIGTIRKCIQQEITKFHLVCVCVWFESGFNDQDVKARPSSNGKI